METPPNRQARTLAATLLREVLNLASGKARGIRSSFFKLPEVRE
jgi:hypothetical protein